MNAPDPKSFYDSVMPQKCGADYEFARWKSSPLMQAQYAMTERTIRTLVTPIFLDKDSILEVGAGPATWTKVLMEANSHASYTLVDISQEMLERARNTLGSPGKVSFIESDFTSFVPQESFDGFFSSRAIEYMSDKQSVVQKIAQVLRPGAKGALITKMPKRLFDRLRGRAPSALHQSQIAPGELVRHFHKAGLRVITVRPATATIPLLRSAFLNRVLFAGIRHLPAIFPFSLFAESYCVVFEKP